MVGEPMAWLMKQLSYEGDDCIPWPYATTEGGYGIVNLNGKQVSAPRYLCELAHGKPPSPLHETAHRCGRGHLGCMTKKHLRWATVKENAADRLLHGTDGRGVKNTMAKLSEEEVREIKSLLGHMKQYKIAEKFGICKQNITLIKKEQRWGWLS